MTKEYCEVCRKLSFNLTYRWGKHICYNCIRHVKAEIRKEYGGARL